MIIYERKSYLSEVGEDSMDFLTSAECAEKWNVSQRRVAIYCKEGRIEGAVLRARMWMIPADAEKPEDPRRVRKMECEKK